MVIIGVWKDELDQFVEPAIVSGVLLLAGQDDEAHE